MTDNMLSNDETKETIIPTKTALDIYREYKENPSQKELIKEIIQMNERKKKRKKKKNDVATPCYPLTEAFPKFVEKTFGNEYYLQPGNNIPPSMVFSSRYTSFFLFGKTEDGYAVGKDHEADGHIAVFGGSGSGKTTGIAIPSLCTWKGTIFSFDFKGDLLKYAIKRRNVKILSFLRGHKNRYWYDPYFFLRQDGEDNLAQNACELANAIIPLPREIREPCWVMAARNILAGAIVYYFRLGKEFIDTLIEVKTTKIEDLLKNFNNDQLAKSCIDPNLNLNPKTLAGVSMELHNHIFTFATDTLIQDILSPSEDGSKEQITWRNLDIGDIFIRMDQSKIEQWGSVIRLMLVQLVRTLERRPEKYEPAGKRIPPTLLLLDEFPQYGKIDVITSSLKILRSKNVTFTLFCQSLADLDETYGKITRCTILDNCSFKAILNASDAETQHYFSDLVGTVKVPKKGISENFDELGHPTGYSVTMNESREPIIHPHEFASLQDIVLLHPGPERFCRIEKETSFRKNLCNNLIEERSTDYGNET